MKLSYWILTVALLLSAIAAYYSILGLVTIFSAAAVPIIVMATAMEVSKVSITVWLHRYWRQAGWPMKSYLVPAVAVLMLITSIGTFGLLSRAHSGQAALNGDISARVAVIDEKIQTERTNIEAARAALVQMNASVDQTLARSTSESGAGRAVQVRKSQARERQSLQSDISKAQERIAQLQEQRAPVAAELRHAEAEVGPVRYVAALIYGDNPDVAMLERAVRWVIILLVMVFDPLAIFMVLASQQSLRWERQRRAMQVSDQNPLDPLTRHIVQDEQMHCEMVERLDTIEDQVENMADLLAEDVAALTNYVSRLEDNERTQSHSQGLPVVIEDDPEPVVGPEPEPVAEVALPEPANERYTAAELTQLEQIWESMHPGFTVDEHRELYRLGLIDYLPWTDRAFAEPALRGEYQHLAEKD